MLFLIFRIHGNDDWRLKAGLALHYQSISIKIFNTNLEMGELRYL